MDETLLHQVITDLATIKAQITALQSRLDERMADTAARCAQEVRARELLDARVHELEMSEDTAKAISHLENRITIQEQKLQMQASIVASITSGALFVLYQLWEWAVSRTVGK